MFWKSSVKCSVVDSSNNHIDVVFLNNNSPSWRLSCFYGFPERSRRKDSWEFIKNLANKSALPWCILGDFNDMLYATDKKGIHKNPQSLLDGFRKAIEECMLVEIDLTGGKYTWEKSRGSKDWVRERLDRAFATASWWQKFPLCKLCVHHTICSDHEPIQLELCSLAHSRRQFRFRFENTWLKEESFHDEVSAFWKNISPVQLLSKLSAISVFMEKWGKEFFNKFREKIKRQKEVIQLYDDCSNAEVTEKYFQESQKLNELLVQEEFYWKQRAKAFWLADGDSNSKFFHAFATSRKKLNHVDKLKNEEGEEVTDHEEMCQVVQRYFTNLFDCENKETEIITEVSSHIISNDQNVGLIADLSLEEFTRAIKQMHPDKAPGPDGLNPAFYQHFWKLLGPEVYLSCKSWMSDLSFPAELNDTIIVLIPKKENADAMKDLRPIALCNILYKVIVKVLANRLKDILHDIITENQSAFVPGRNISDNVLVAFELLHFMKRKNYGSNGEVALKLDVSKAYDRVNWNYLNNRMEQMGFASKWISWIMLCVQTVSYSISFNGSQIGPVNPNRGLRQGDPLSPYLFLLCVEGLSFLLTKVVENGKIHGCQSNAHAPSVTHLLFADDSFLFFKASSEELNEVVSVLQKYEEQSGQAINFLKSGIFFSSNVRMDKQQEIKELLGVHSDLSVGKAVLLLNVAQAIPSYAMSCFMLPKSLCQELERMMNSFWWVSKGNNRKGIRWLSWENMSMAKGKGGMGFRDLHGFNLALLGKHCWNMLWRGVSYVWSGIWQAKEALKQGFRWVLGDGEDIRVFEDAWLKGKTDFRVDSGNNNRGGISKVKELFIPGEKRWDTFKVHNLFSSCDAKMILATPIPRGQVYDRLAWKGSADDGWKQLWRLDIPHKLKIFLWRLSRNNIPYCGLEFDVTRMEVASDWLLDKLSSESTEVCGRIVAIFWGIWFARNQKVWEQKILTPDLALQWSMKQVTQWREMNQSKKLLFSGMSRSPLSFVVRWKAPVEGRVKLNVDASIYPGTSSFSLGMVLQNHAGSFIQAKTMVKAGVVTVLEAEVWGIAEAIEWVQSLSLFNVDIESDSLLAVNALLKGVKYFTEVGNVLNVCQTSLRSHSRLSVSFVKVKKQANKVAHLFARVPCMVGCFKFFQSPPSYMLETLMYDSTLI
ncbi:hypothetical protein AgCh_001610 [Apium graveolens]